VSAAGFVASALLQILVPCAVVLALCDLCGRVFRLAGMLAFCAAILALGVIGYLAFWLALASYPVFGLVKVLVLAGLIAWCGVVAWRYRPGDHRWLIEPLLFAALFVVIVLALGLSGGGFADPTSTATARFTPALPRDNEIPFAVANALRFGRLPSPLFGDWLASDRPPLQSGLYLLLFLRNGIVGYQIVASWLQATFLFGVWAVVTAAGLGAVRRRLALLACCLLPVALINTFFVWPKLLAAGYLLGVFALVLCHKPATAAEQRASGVLIGGLAALAMLSHGSSAFGLIGFAVAVLVFRSWPSLRSMVHGTLALLALYAPWMLYQRFVDPPGSRLLKWHLAGVVDVDGRSFGQALRDSYAALSWPDYLGGRLANLEMLLGPWPASLRDLFALGFGGTTPADLLRKLDFFYLAPSLHGFALAVPLALACLPLVPASQRAIALRMLVAVVATLASFALLMFIPGSAVNHQGTYATQPLIAIFVMVVLSSRTPWPAALFVALQAVTVAMLYAVTLRHDSLLMLAICAAAVAGLAGYSLAPLRPKLGPDPEAPAS
jgi:hypothetical protein